MKYLITEDGKDKTYSLPTVWNNVKLDSYMKVCAILENKDDDEYRQTFKLLRALMGLKTKTIEKMPLSVIRQIYKDIAVLIQQPIDDNLRHKIKINKTVYGFHPQLSNLTLGEFVDIEAYIKDGIHKNMHNILSVLYRPITKEKGHQYNIEPYEPSDDRAELFKENLTIGDVNGASVFFYSLGKELLSYSAKYLKKAKTKK
tara:strand:+ start:431 stop:1033 length:603 start_codon:yes stop_codon:yes gene_type:complete